MKKTIPANKVTGREKKINPNHLYVAFLNEKMLSDNTAVQYSCRQNNTDDFFDENWMPAVIMPEENELLYDKYY